MPKGLIILIFHSHYYLCQMSHFNTALHICVLKFNKCVSTQSNAKDVSILWCIKNPKTNEMGSLLVLLNYLFKHCNWQTPSNLLTAPGGVLVEHQRDGGRIWHMTLGQDVDSGKWNLSASSSKPATVLIAAWLSWLDTQTYCIIQLVWFSFLWQPYPGDHPSLCSVGEWL